MAVPYRYKPNTERLEKIDWLTDMQGVKLRARMFDKMIDLYVWIQEQSLEGGTEVAILKDGEVIAKQEIPGHNFLDKGAAE